MVGTNGPTNNLSQPQFQPNLMIPFVQDSISAISPFNALTSNTGATFGLAFLSDLEVYFFLRAVQGDQRSNLVQAPKVTTFNGAPASVFSTTQNNYVAALTPVVGAGAVAFQPQIAGFQDGVQLFVTPVVSADRRYVRMTLVADLPDASGFRHLHGAGGGRRWRPGWWCDEHQRPDPASAVHLEPGLDDGDGAGRRHGASGRREASPRRA